ncbi:hypothetical protein TCON_1915 [Astathelohania contejeani]|uniref:Uncharacterized protein n=1 Tax=Astathelohania contejeani TaxID=164912 RepID=A0ABQ7HXJ9_9MICR|nr:hypothetical protein TCON_1915 [Thelohania contejeani]
MSKRHKDEKSNVDNMSAIVELKNEIKKKNAIFLNKIKKDIEVTYNHKKCQLNEFFKLKERNIDKKFKDYNSELIIISQKREKGIKFIKKKINEMLECLKEEEKKYEELNTRIRKYKDICDKEYKITLNDNKNYKSKYEKTIKMIKNKINDKIDKYDNSENNIMSIKEIIQNLF